MKDFNLKAMGNKTLTQLEGNDWGSAKSDSYIEKACHELRHKRLVDLSIEDMRMLVGQEIGIDYLMPLVLEELEKDPLARGMHYYGDLLSAALRINTDFYRKNENFKKRIERIIGDYPQKMDVLDEDDYNCTKEALDEGVEAFRSEA